MYSAGHAYFFFATRPRLNATLSWSAALPLATHWIRFWRAKRHSRPTRHWFRVMSAPHKRLC